MKKILVIFLLIIPFLSYSQGNILYEDFVINLYNKKQIKDKSYTLVSKDIIEVKKWYDEKPRKWISYDTRICLVHCGFIINGYFDLAIVEPYNLKTYINYLNKYQTIVSPYSWDEYREDSTVVRTVLVSTNIKKFFYSYILISSSK